MFSIFSTLGENVGTDFPAKVVCSGCSGVLPRFSLPVTGLGLHAPGKTANGKKAFVTSSLQGLLWSPHPLFMSLRMSSL